MIDPNENLFYIGITEESIKAFRQYGDNEYAPPTIYHSRYGWLCTSCQPIMLEKRTLCVFCVDIDMNEVMKERNWFLANSLICVLLETAAAIVISMVLIRRSITRPLMLLAKSTWGFADSNEDISKEDVIQLPIRSRDEIGTLYRSSLTTGGIRIRKRSLKASCRISGFLPQAQNSLTISRCLGWLIRTAAMYPGSVMAGEIGG